MHLRTFCIPNLWVADTVADHGKRIQKHPFATERYGVWTKGTAVEARCQKRGRNHWKNPSFDCMSRCGLLELL